MGKLITIVGNSGAGKTTLTQRICAAFHLVPALEQHAGRPFQKLFSEDLHRYSLGNQVDYLLLRAEQELSIRQMDGIGVQDGSLDLDFNIFTQHFFKQGYLSPAEYQICERMYRFFRKILPPPDLIVRLTAPIDVLAQRREERKRPLDITKSPDLLQLEQLMDAWLNTNPKLHVIVVDTTAEDKNYADTLRVLAQEIKRL